MIPQPLPLPAALPLPARLLLFWLALLPAWWFAGLDILLYHLLAVLLLLVQPLPQRGGHTLVLLLVVIGFYLLLMALFQGLGDAPPRRVVSAVYNATIWILCAIVLAQTLHLLRSPPVGERFLLRLGGVCTIVFWLCLTLAGIVVVVALATGYYRLTLPTLFGLMAPSDLPGMLARAQEAVLVFADWGSGRPLPRVAMFGLWSPSAALVMALLGSFALYHAAARGVSRTAFWALTAAVFVAILLTHTRTALAGFVLGTVLVPVLFAHGARRSIALVALAVLVPLATLLLLGAFDDVTGFRIRSTETRLTSYMLAIDLVVQQSPLFGIGIKPLDEDVVSIAIGSHSTIISTFLKGGILATLVMLAALYLLPGLVWLRLIFNFSASRQPVPQLRRQAGVLFRMQLILWLWIAFGDLDAVPVAAVLIAFYYALLFWWEQQVRGQLAAPHSGPALYSRSG